MPNEMRRGYEIEISKPEPADVGSIVGSIVGPMSVGLPGDSGQQAVATPLAPALHIDGEVVPYLESEEGFSIYYQPSEPSLLQAARSFVDTQPEKRP